MTDFEIRLERNYIQNLIFHYRVYPTLTEAKIPIPKDGF